MDGATVFRYADDGSLPLRPGETAAQVLAQRRDLELHEYYEQIRPHTFQTTFVPVDLATAEAWRVENRGGRLSADQQERMVALRAEVDDRIREVTGDEAGGALAFVRLSTRSPKDSIEASPALRARAVALLRQRLQQGAHSAGRHGGDALANLKLRAVQEVTSELLGVRSAAEAFELLSTSSRCVSDLVRLLDHREHLPSWDLHLIVRRFVPLPPQSEFRCFVHERRLTAISQYFASCFFPELPGLREPLQQRIEAFVSARIPEIRLDSYIMDVAVTLGDATPPAMACIIELNPFAPTTGACLFDWDADADLLRHGPPQLRLLDAPKPHVDVYLQPFHDLLHQAAASQQADSSSSSCAIQ